MNQRYEHVLRIYIQNLCNIFFSDDAVLNFTHDFNYISISLYSTLPVD
jgi:hypothetical protein